MPSIVARGRCHHSLLSLWVHAAPSMKSEIPLPIPQRGSQPREFLLPRDWRGNGFGPVPVRNLKKPSPSAQESQLPRSKETQVRRLGGGKTTSWQRLQEGTQRPLILSGVSVGLPAQPRQQLRPDGRVTPTQRGSPAARHS